MILEGVRLADCKLLRCGRERDDTRQLCPECEQRLLADLEWFTKNIGYLETDKMNRINKNHDANGGGEDTLIIRHCESKCSTCCMRVTNTWIACGAHYPRSLNA